MNNVEEILRTNKETICVEARAGVGKTHMLYSYIKNNPQENILYISYNKSVEIDAKKQGFKNIDARTSHSLAKKYMYKNYNNGFWNRVGEINEKDIANFLNVEITEATLILQVYKNYYSSSDQHVNSSHTILPSGTPEDLQDTIIHNLINYTQKLFNAVTEAITTLPVDHDVYLKVWINSNPEIKNIDTILVDECQDQSQCFIDFVLKQKCKKIFVGDQNQAIYQYRIRNEFNFFKYIKPDFTMSQTYRFGQEVADIANLLLKIKGEAIPVIGNPNIKTRIGPVDPNQPYTVLSRKNVTQLEDAINTPHDKKLAINTEYFDDIRSIWNLKYNIPHNHTPLTEKFKTYEDVYKSAKKRTNIFYYIHYIIKYKKELPELLKGIEDRVVSKYQSPDISYYTIHKVKGSTFNNVKLLNDFEDVSEFKSLTPRQIEEISTLYTAITRPKYVLELNHMLEKLISKGTQSVENDYEWYYDESYKDNYEEEYDENIREIYEEEYKQFIDNTDMEE